MGFDIRFLARPPDEEQPAVTEHAVLTEGQVAMWQRLEARVRPISPGAATVAAETSRQLADPGSGLELSFSSSGLTLAAPDSHPRHVLREVASAVEHETGLTAYDTLTGRPFVEPLSPTTAAAAPAPAPTPVDPVARPVTSVIPTDAVKPYSVSLDEPVLSPRQQRKQQKQRTLEQAAATPAASDKEPSRLVLKVMLLSYIPAGLLLFTPLGLIGALLVIVLARIGLRLWWRSRPH